MLLRFLTNGLLAAALGAAMAGGSDAAPEVSPQNGNLTLKLTDVSYAGGLGLKLERVYNSKTPYRGMFGWGWGTELELYLDVLGDGSVVVHEYGGGAENMFVPASLASAEIDAAVERLVAARRGERALPADSAIGYAARLRDDAIFRSEEWTRLVRAGKLAARALPEGTRLRSLRFGRQEIVRTATGWVRKGDDGKTETFDDRGRLLRIEKEQSRIELAYDAEGRLTSATDELGRAIRLERDAQGHVTAARGDQGAPVKYRYDARGDLVAVVAGDEAPMRYDYDARHDLTRIRYPDGDSVVVTYHPPALDENVRSIQRRDGTITRYEYARDGADGLRTVVVATTVEEPGSDEPDTSVTRYEYTERRRANGDLWTERVVTTKNGTRTDALYNECCGLPLVVVVGGHDTTTFEYDRAGRITRKESRSELDSLAYDARLGKLARIVRRTRGEDVARWTNFAYDSAGNLVEAVDHEGKSVKLQYDAKGKIHTMISPDATLHFAYNEIGKPVRIELEKVGVLTVAYEPNGEIQKVDSDGGHRVSLAVTQAFQGLLQLVNTKDVAPCRVSFAASTCQIRNRPMRLPDTTLPRTGGTCAASEGVCRAGSRDDEE